MQRDKGRRREPGSEATSAMAGRGGRFGARQVEEDGEALDLTWR